MHQLPGLFFAEAGITEGTAVRAPIDTTIGGNAAPIVLTTAAHDAAVAWDRSDLKLDERARWTELVDAAGAAIASTAHDGLPHSFRLYRVPNRTQSGDLSKTHLGSGLTLVARAEFFSAQADLCVTIALPGDN